MRGIAALSLVAAWLTVGAATASAVPVTIEGTDGPDQIRIAADSHVSGTYYVNGAATAFAEATSITVNGRAGGDTLTIDNVGPSTEDPPVGPPLLAPPLGVRFNGGDGIDDFYQRNGTAQEGSFEHDVDGPGTRTIRHTGESNQKIVLDGAEGAVTDWVLENRWTYRGYSGPDDISFADLPPEGTDRCCGRQYVTNTGEMVDPRYKTTVVIDTRGTDGADDVVTLKGRWRVAPELIVDDGAAVPEDVVKLQNYRPTGPRDWWVDSDISIRAEVLQDVGSDYYRLEATGLAAEVDRIEQPLDPPGKPLSILVDRLELDVAEGDVVVETGQSTSIGGFSQLGGVRSRTGRVWLKCWGFLTVPSGDTITAPSDVTVNAGWLDLQGTVSAPAGTVRLEPSRDEEVNLGAVGDSGFVLSVSDLELDRVAAQRVQVGAADGGLVTVSAPVTANLPLELVGRGGFTGSGARVVRAPTIALRDTSATDRTWLIDGLGVQVTPGAAILLMLEYRSTFHGGAGADEFRVKASPFAPISVDGGDPSTLPGDRLTYSAEGRTTAGDTSPPDGSITSPQRKAVDFRAIERVSILP